MAKPPRQSAPPDDVVDLRIIGGTFRGRKLRYLPHRIGDELVTRPMKHRVREAIFNLVGVAAQGRLAIDVFAGTGALGLEALSRGAARALFIERHVPTAQVVEENIATLGVAAQSRVLVASAFLWAKRDLAPPTIAALPASRSVPVPSDFLSTLPWLVFLSPPYEFFASRQEDMLDLVQRILDAAPAESLLVVEADERLDFSQLPTAASGGGRVGSWDVRTYSPAVVGVWRETAS